MEGTAGTHLAGGWRWTGHGETPRSGSHGLGAGAVFPGDIVFPSHPSSPGRRRQRHAHPLCEEAPSRLATGRPEPPLPRNSARRIFSDASGNRVRGGGENRRPAPGEASVHWWGSTGFGGRRGMGERGSEERESEERMLVPIDMCSPAPSTPTPLTSPAGGSGQGRSPRTFRPPSRERTRRTAR